MNTAIAALRRRRWSLAWLLGLAALALLLIWLATIPLLRGEPDGRVGPLVGKPAPAIDLERLDGGRWALGDTNGRLTWVNFWATSCEPCRTEMPAMQRLSELHAGDLQIVGIDWGEERAAVADFVGRYAITYPILLDPTLETYYRWADTDGLPRHYFIGPDGTVLREIVGPLDPGRMVEVVDQLLAGIGA
jgi:thiol-disulfide isomerase/thioredoxin